MKPRLVVRSLLHYWRTNLAVMLGVAAGTAVIGGALIVGDSVRGSLREMTLSRLGNVDHVLSTHRFFRQDLVERLAVDAAFKKQFFKKRFAALAPAIVMQAGFEHEIKADEEGASAKTRRVGRVNVYGVDHRFWKLTGGDMQLAGDEVVLGSRVAGELSAATGDRVSLWIELPVAIPRDSLLGERTSSSIKIDLTVKSVLGDEGVGLFNLNPNQQQPLNAFVSLSHLQESLELNERTIRKGRQIIQKYDRVNAVFVQAKDEPDGQGDTAEQASQRLGELLAGNIRSVDSPTGPALPDLYLRIVANAEQGYVAIESEQQILPRSFERAGRDAAKKLGLETSPVLVYLANELANKNDADSYRVNSAAAGSLGAITHSGRKFAMYSIVAGLNFPIEQPFKSFEFTAGAPDELGDDEIVVNDWLAADLGVKPGDSIYLNYHQVGAHGELPETTATFTVKGVVKLDGAAADKRLTPDVEGITDAKDFRSWRQPFDMNLDRVTHRDDDYWDQYQATPKAFVSLQTAQRLWGSKYGRLTSLRVAAADEDVKQLIWNYKTEFLESLSPQDSGLFFQPVKYRQLQAAGGTTDFSGLFLAFSFFLILSATILIGLLFRLGLERRGTQVGLLAAVGFAPRTVRQMYLLEGLTVVVAGGLLGVLAAWLYAEVMVYGLTTWWLGAIGTRSLRVFVEPLSLAIGFVAAVLVAMAAVWWALRQFRLLSARELLAGATEPPRKRGRRRIALWTGLGSAAIAALLLLTALFGLLPAGEAFGGFSWQIVAFFTIGALSLTAALTLLSAWLASDRQAAVRGSGLLGVGRLAMRNAARSRLRSVMTVGLIASAAFVITAVAAGHRNPAAEEPDRNSGNGGYTLVAETSVPILYDLNSPEGRNKLDLATDTTPAAERELLEAIDVMPFRVQPGEDASCLNIYQTRLPTILGVTDRMIARGGFKFAGAKVENPWTLLSEDSDSDDGVPVYPVLGDMNTLQYSLHKGVGDFVNVPAEAQTPDYRLKIVGMFDGSVFQGVLLMSDENFKRLYPERKGFEYFLIEAPTDRAEAATDLLESKLAPYGFDAERVSQKLADFLNVQNTYLSTFQALGGLGLLLGTLGLATVMLRNVLERRSELALLRAVGFTNGSLAWLILWENALLLFWGLAAGTASALLAMAPHLASTGADVPWLQFTAMLTAVIVVGMLAALAAVAEALRTPLLATLRAD